MHPRLTLAVTLVSLAAAAHAESFRSWAARGAREEREKDPRAAISSYSNALSMWSDADGNAGKAKVLCARGALREKEGDDPGAVRDLSDCLGLDKKNARSFHRRGALFLRTGKTSAAIGDFYRAVALDLGFAKAYADRARAYEIQGETIFAREDYRRACDLGVKPACLKAPVATKTATRRASYTPRFQDCRASLERCIETGQSIGACVSAASACGPKPAANCCPAACLTAYRKALGDRSEAAAFRQYFSPTAKCSSPKEAGD